MSSAGRVLATIRCLAIPLFFAAEQLVDHPAQQSGPFGLLLLLAAAYAVATLGSELVGRSIAPGWALGVVDLLLISVLVATSGGPFSQLRYAFFLLPVGAALLLRPGATAIASVANVAMYALIALTFPGDEDVRPDAVGFEVTQSLFLAWMGGAATLLSLLLTRRAQDITQLAADRTELAASRGRLVAQALDAEDMARRRLAEALHDDALQNVLAARQELGAADVSLDLVVEGLDRTVEQLREAVFDLHPYLLEQAGLGAALRAVAEREARRGNFTPSVDIDSAAEGLHDHLLFSIGRELLTNAAKHSGARNVSLGLKRAAKSVELTASDDGAGLNLAAAASAVSMGHIGLASCRERVEAVGGSLKAGPGPGGQGTTVRVCLPT